MSTVMAEMDILVALGHEVPCRFRDQQLDFKGKSCNMVVSRIFGVTSALLDIFGLIWDIFRLIEDILYTLDVYGPHLTVGFGLSGPVFSRLRIIAKLSSSWQFSASQVELRLSLSSLYSCPPTQTSIFEPFLDHLGG